MKLVKIPILIFLFLTSLSLIQLKAQALEADSTGLPGDHFSLEGALDLFQKASSPEDFEKELNAESNFVNNLDLNEDGQVDYIRVVHHMEGDVHAIVLQALVSEQESQDIAVIEIEKTGPEEAILQILGDEDIFGETILVEPADATETGGGKGGPSSFSQYTRVVVNVFFWPCVRLVYSPSYRVWVSPYRWGYYPTWYKPWRPRPWAVFYPRVAVYKPRYRVVTTHRVVRAHRVYSPKRTYSTAVRTRTVAVKSRRGPTVTKTTKTVTGPRGNQVQKKQTTVQGRGGRVRAQKSTTTVKKKRGN